MRPSSLMEVIASRDEATMVDLLAGSPGRATAALPRGATRASAAGNFLAGIGHHIYAGDTALHVAAAKHRPKIVRVLIDLGVDVTARNRRGATPLTAKAQQAEIVRLFERDRG